MHNDFGYLLVLILVVYYGGFLKIYKYFYKILNLMFLFLLMICNRFLPFWN